MGPGIIDVFTEYWQIFLRGAIGTLEFAFIAVFFGSLIGALVALLRLSRNPVFRGIATVYATVIRGTPLLVQMYIWYFFVPMAMPALGLAKEQCVMLALILNSAAYVSEIIRSGINSVDSGQTEAARSLGMTAKNTMVRIVLPQAIKNILPALANEYITMIKETSLAGTFMMYELMYTRVLLANKFLIWQPLFIVAAIYLIMTTGLTALVRYAEKRFAVSD
ncbi:MAG: amino acid ABC transporter permease [Solobacterium sp.]|nr:amino acid ABC transporter permease [Solobacterium sp.]MBR2829824.1 amino acid ABC transporter permease [Solobacterium sp.]MBR3128717.1 amino acid ABC transporter permease [Solobacterium sp.]